MRVADPEQTPGAEAAAEPGARVGTARFAPRAYGPDLVDRWKGRAFQQSPDSSVSLVGFEDEQVNWEANSSLLGWRSGPVRTIREIWGADSGTNVTKTETFWRDVVWHRYRVRVHPIPPDGLYSSWDYDRDDACLDDGTGDDPVPTAAPTNVGEPYGNVVRARVQPVVVPIG